METRCAAVRVIQRCSGYYLAVSGTMGFPNSELTDGAASPVSVWASIVKQAMSMECLVRSSVVCHDSETVAYLATYLVCKRDVMLFLHSQSCDPLSGCLFATLL